MLADGEPRVLNHALPAVLRQAVLLDDILRRRDEARLPLAVCQQRRRCEHAALWPLVVCKRSCSPILPELHSSMALRLMTTHIEKSPEAMSISPHRKRWKLVENGWAPSAPAVGVP